MPTKNPQPARPRITPEMVKRGALAIGRLAYREAQNECAGNQAQIARKPEAKDIEFYSKYARAVLRANLAHIADAPLPQLRQLKKVLGMSREELGCYPATLFCAVADLSAKKGGKRK